MMFIDNPNAAAAVTHAFNNALDLRRWQQHGAKAVGIMHIGGGHEVALLLAIVPVTDGKAQFVTKHI